MIPGSIHRKKKWRKIGCFSKLSNQYVYGPDRLLWKGSYAFPCCLRERISGAYFSLHSKMLLLWGLWNAWLHLQLYRMSIVGKGWTDLGLQITSLEKSSFQIVLVHSKLQYYFLSYIWNRKPCPFLVLLSHFTNNHLKK